MRFILMPDSFKGTMSSQSICDEMQHVIQPYFPDAEIIKIPVADGGEGSVDCFLQALGGEKVQITVEGPYREPVESFYGLLDEGRTAVIEMAAAAGLPLVGNQTHVEQTTTYGVGQLMVDAVRRGCEQIILGLGGSATNDMGMGAAAAAGVRFYNSEGDEFIPVGKNLSDISKIDMSGFLPEFKNIRIVSMCDINNPLFGENGAAYVFAPQKGADSEMVRHLDLQLRSASESIQKDLGIDISNLPGSGAAGGMGGGMVAFFGAKLQAGIETVLDTVDFNSFLTQSTIIFTGEGKIDSQSLRGKVVIGIARRAKTKNIPVIAIVGDIGDSIEQAYEEGVSGIFSINRVAVDFETAKKRCRQDLNLTMDNLMRLFKNTKTFPSN